MFQSHLIDNFNTSIMIKKDHAERFFSSDGTRTWKESAVRRVPPPRKTSAIIVRIRWHLQCTLFLKLLQEYNADGRIIGMHYSHSPFVLPFPKILYHTWYLSRTHGRCPCKFFLAGVNFYRFNAKNWHFRQILRKKSGFFFTDLMQKICVFRCKFYHPKILPL